MLKEKVSYRKTKNAIETRIKFKAAIKQMPLLIEKIIANRDLTVFNEFFSKSVEDILMSWFKIQQH